MSQLSIAEQGLQRIRGWFSDNSTPLKLFFISRIGLFILVYLSLILIPIAPERGRAHPENLFFDGWSRWDSNWYVGISGGGYSNVEHSIGQDTAFFPFYPILLRLATEIVKDPHYAGILVSNISFLFALIVLYKLIRSRFGSKIADRTLTLICFGAFSFYFSALYTESVFLLAVACAFYFCEREKYLWAACWAALAGATRLLGVVIIIPLVILYLEQIDYEWRRIKPNILLLSISLLGTIAYMLYLEVNFDNALQFMSSQNAWRSLNPLDVIIQTVRSLSFLSITAGSYPVINLIHLLTLLGSIILAIAYSKKVGLAYTVFCVMGITTSVSRVYGMGRYVIVIFPLFVAAAFFLRNKDLYHFFLYINILLLALFSILFSHWYWVA